MSVVYAPPSITTSIDLGEQPAIAGDPGPMADDRGVPLGRRGEVLVAVVDHPDRSPGTQREERGVEPDHRRVLLLATEPAAGLGLDDPGLAAIDGEAALERRVDVVRALQRAVDDDPAVLARDRDHRVVLDVQLLLVADAVLALEDEVGGREGRLGIAVTELVARRRRAPRRAGRRPAAAAPCGP